MNFTIFLFSSTWTYDHKVNVNYVDAEFDIATVLVCTKFFFYTGGGIFVVENGAILRGLKQMNS